MPGGYKTLVHSQTQNKAHCIGCLWTGVHKQTIIALYFEFETVLKFYNLQAWFLNGSEEESSNYRKNIVYVKILTN